MRVPASSKKVKDSRSPNTTGMLLLLLLYRTKCFSFRWNPKGRVPSHTVRNSAHLNRGAKNTAEALCLIAWYYCNMSILSGCWSPSTLSAGGTWLNWIPEKGKPSPPVLGNPKWSSCFGLQQQGAVLGSEKLAACQSRVEAFFLSLSLP